MFIPALKDLGSSSPDCIHPVVPLFCAGGAEPIGQVFALDHPASVLRLAGLDLLSLGVIQLPTELFKHTSNTVTEAGSLLVCENCKVS